jgi:hypothetical protein
MKYRLLVILDERRYEALSGSDLQALDDVALDYTDALPQKGQYLGGSALRGISALHVANAG